MAFNRLDGGVLPLHELRLSQATEVPFPDTPRPSPRTNRTRRVPHAAAKGDAFGDVTLAGDGGAVSFRPPLPLPLLCSLLHRRSALSLLPTPRAALVGAATRPSPREGRGVSD